MSGCRRRVLAAGLVTAALLVVTVGLLATANQQYVYARPLSHPFLAAVFAAPMLALAAGLAITGKVPRNAIFVAAVIIGYLACGVGAAWTWMNQGLGGRPSVEATVATSGEFTVVAYRQPGFLRSDVLALRVRSRAGLWSREGGDIACFALPGAWAGPEWQLGRVRFTARDTLEVSTGNGVGWPLRFDTGTLDAVGVTLDRCTEAPDPMAD